MLIASWGLRERTYFTAMKSGDSFSFIFSEGNRSEVEYYTFYKSMTDRQMVEERGRRGQSRGG